MRKIVMVAAVAGVLALSACKKEEAPAATETTAEATEAVATEAATEASTEAAAEATSEAPKM
jgi:predicted lipoprotein